MHKLLEHCSLYTYDYTYIGIGSKNRTDDLEKFDTNMDQILPCFLNEVKGKMIRAIHFDSRFQEDSGFLSKYFQSKGLKKYGDFWRSDNVEVIILPMYMENDKWFLNEMVMQAAYDRTKLVVQYFTGFDCIPMFKEIYAEAPENDKSHIEKHVLFDITYGNGHCMTLMSEHFPMIDKNGDFYNFALYTEKDMIKSVGLLPQMDKLIESYILKQLSKVLNDNHINYRKSVHGEPHMFNSEYYDQSATSDEIMEVLILKTALLLEILKALGSLSKEKQELFQECVRNYKQIDMYKWYSDMTKLYK